MNILNKMKSKLQKCKTVLTVTAMSTFALASNVFAAAAGDIDMSTVTTSLQSSFSSIVTSCTNFIGTVLPSALSLVGIGIVIMFGVKTFKKLTAKA